MSTPTKRNQVVHAIQEIYHNIGNFIAGAVARIFGLDDDDYPETGVQPFEGDRPSRR